MTWPVVPIYTKHEFGIDWLKIFSHTLTNNNYFTNNEKEFHFTEGNGKFSILGLITDDFKIDGYYEFLLQYPNQVAIDLYTLEKNFL